MLTEIWAFYGGAGVGGFFKESQYLCTICILSQRLNFTADYIQAVQAVDYQLNISQNRGHPSRKSKQEMKKERYGEILLLSFKYVKDQVT